MENNIPASENFEPEENSDQNPSASYGQSNYDPGSQPQYIPYSQSPQQPQVNFGIYENYFEKNNQNQQLNLEELKKMHSVSVSSIYVFIFWLILLIFVIAFSVVTTKAYASALLNPPTSSTPWSTSSGSSSNNYSSLSEALSWFEALLGIFWAIVVIACGSIGAVRAWEISKNLRFFIVVMIFYIIGFFVPILQFIAACVSLSKIKQYLSLYKPS